MLTPALPFLLVFKRRRRTSELPYDHRHTSAGQEHQRRDRAHRRARQQVLQNGYNDNWAVCAVARISDLEGVVFASSARMVSITACISVSRSCEMRSLAALRPNDPPVIISLSAPSKASRVALSSSLMLF